MEENNPAPLFETYEVKGNDKELHCMDVMMEALRRHLLPDGQRTVSDDELLPARRAVRWLASRIGA